jgi:hypothetical protein
MIRKGKGGGFWQKSLCRLPDGTAFDRLAVCRWSSGPFNFAKHLVFSYQGKAGIIRVTLLLP